MKPDQKLMDLYGTHTVYQNKVAGVPGLANILWGLHLANEEVDSHKQHLQQEAEAEEFNRRAQMLEAIKMSPTVQAARYTHVPHRPHLEDESMIHVASALQKLAERMAAQDVALLRQSVMQKEAGSVTNLVSAATQGAGRAVKAVRNAAAGAGLAAANVLTPVSHITPRPISTSTHLPLVRSPQPNAGVASAVKAPTVAAPAPSPVTTPAAPKPAPVSAPAPGAKPAPDAAKVAPPTSSAGTNTPKPAKQPAAPAQVAPPAQAPAPKPAAAPAAPSVQAPPTQKSPTTGAAASGGVPPTLQSPQTAPAPAPAPAVPVPQIQPPAAQAAAPAPKVTPPPPKVTPPPPAVTPPSSLRPIPSMGQAQGGAPLPAFNLEKRDAYGPLPKPSAPPAGMPQVKAPAAVSQQGAAPVNLQEIMSNTHAARGQLQQLDARIAKITDAERATGQADHLLLQRKQLQDQLATHEAQYANAFAQQHGADINDLRAQAPAVEAPPSTFNKVVGKLTPWGLAGAGTLGLLGYGAYKTLNKGLDVLGSEGHGESIYGSGAGAAPGAVNQYGMPAY